MRSIAAGRSHRSNDDAPARLDAFRLARHTGHRVDHIVLALALALAMEAEVRKSAAATRRMTPFTVHMMARPRPEIQSSAKGILDRISLQIEGFDEPGARSVLSALQKIGWRIARRRGSHRVLVKEGHPNFVFAFQESEEIGPRMLSRIARHTGLRPEDL